MRFGQPRRQPSSPSEAARISCSPDVKHVVEAHAQRRLEGEDIGVELIHRSVSVAGGADEHGARHEGSILAVTQARATTVRRSARAGGEATTAHSGFRRNQVAQFSSAKETASMLCPSGLSTNAA
jgi:hypothetical protein